MTAYIADTLVALTVVIAFRRVPIAMGRPLDAP
jgi:hypothetical protein